MYIHGPTRCALGTVHVCVHTCGAHLTWELLPQRTPSPMPRALCWRRGWRWTKAINPSPPPAAPVLPESNVPSAPAVLLVYTLIHSSYTTIMMKITDL
jgi:hypothetical protein